MYGVMRNKSKRAFRLAVALGDAESPLSPRSRRVLVMCIGILLLSAADLIITLAFLKANSMMEANPIAVWLITYTQSAWALSAFKASTVGVCVAVLLRYRASWASEAAAWCAVAILAVMSVMWREYSNHFEDTHFVLLTQGPTMTATADDSRLGLP